jgi:L-iditol 2-dehydrogenase
MCINSLIRPGDSVVVLGPGPIGLLCARMAALSGADPLIVAGLDADGPRLEAARQLGATHTVNLQTRNLEEVVRDLRPDGADVVCDATGASRPLEDAIRIARPNGQVTKVGWSPEKLAVDMNPLVLRNVRIQGSFSHNYLVWERVIHLLDRRATLPETIVGLRSPLEGWREAFDAMHDRRVIKSVLLPNGH